MLKEFTLFQIIPDKQPLLVCAQPALHGDHNELVIGDFSLWQVQVVRDIQYAGGERRARFCIDPEHRCIALPKAMRVLHCHLGFAYSTQTMNGAGARETPCLLTTQACMDALQDLLAPGEERIAQRGNVPGGEGVGGFVSTLCLFRGRWQQTQFCHRFPKKLRQFLAVDRAGEGHAVFPPIDHKGIGSTNAVSHLLLRPALQLAGLAQEEIGGEEPCFLARHGKDLSSKTFNCATTPPLVHLLYR
jgi:hypothetical protein